MFYDEFDFLNDSSDSSRIIAENGKTFAGRVILLDNSFVM